MTTTPPEPDVYDLGPGELKIGATGSEIDVSCLVNNAKIAMSKDEGDSTTKLCGTVRPGSVKYTFALSGNVDTDIADDSGLFALSQTAKGTEQDFTFTPSSDATTTAVGKVIIDPLDFGGDETGQPMTSDFEWSLVGDPAYTYPVIPLARSGNGGATTKSPVAAGA